MSIKEIIEELNNLFEYVEEPDAFETESELKLEKEFSDEMDKAMRDREFLLNKLYRYLLKRKWVKDIQIIDNSIRFTVEGDYLSLVAFHKWSGESKLLKKFKMKQYNGEEYNIDVYIN